MGGETPAIPHPQLVASTALSAGMPQAPNNSTGQVTAHTQGQMRVIMIPSAQAKHLIGQNGCNITRIREQSQSQIKITRGEPCTITLWGNTELAERMIYEQNAKTTAMKMIYEPGVMGVSLNIARSRG